MAIGACLHSEAVTRELIYLYRSIYMRANKSLIYIISYISICRVHLHIWHSHAEPRTQPPLGPRIPRSVPPHSVTTAESDDDDDSTESSEHKTDTEKHNGTGIHACIPDS